jgi:hypothetical protein
VIIHRSGPEWAAVCDEPAFIDPVHGFVVTDRGVLLEHSLETNFEHPKAPWRIGTPSPFRRVPSAPRTTPQVVEYPCVISLRHRWEWNYYHFFLDVLGKLDLVDRLGLDRDTPIVLGRYAREMGFVTQVLSAGALADRRWVVPDLDNRLVVRAERVVYCRTNRPFADRVTHLLDEMDVALPDPDADDRIFLTRSAPATRRLINEDEILPVLQHFGFRTVETASMSVQDSIASFRNARHVVALHGAGVSNIIFRRGEPLGLLELHSDTFAGPGDMRRICTELGYAHDSLAGRSDGGPPIHASYRIDPMQLHDSIERLLSAPPHIRRSTSEASGRGPARHQRGAPRA